MKLDVRNARSFLLLGATMLPVGIAFAAADSPTIASVFTLFGLAVLIGGLHTFGRAGPDLGG